jgi:hypothetical protein
MSGALATLIFWVAHVSGLALAFADVGVFTAVFIACTGLVFRRAAQAAVAADRSLGVLEPARGE